MERAKRKQRETKQSQLLHIAHYPCPSHRCYHSRHSFNYPYGHPNRHPLPSPLPKTLFLIPLPSSPSLLCLFPAHHTNFAAKNLVGPFAVSRGRFRMLSRIYFGKGLVKHGLTTTTPPILPRSSTEETAQTRRPSPISFLDLVSCYPIPSTSPPTLSAPLLLPQPPLPTCTHPIFLPVYSYTQHPISLSNKIQDPTRILQPLFTALLNPPTSFYPPIPPIHPSLQLPSTLPLSINVPNSNQPPDLHLFETQNHKTTKTTKQPVSHSIPPMQTPKTPNPPHQTYPPSNPPIPLNTIIIPSPNLNPVISRTLPHFLKKKNRTPNHLPTPTPQPDPLIHSLVKFKYKTKHNKAQPNNNHERTKMIQNSKFNT